MSSAPVSRFRSTSHPVSNTGDITHLGLRLALILVASFMVVLDFSIVNVALPSIERELGMTAAAVQWVITGYAIAFGGLLILGGRAADLFGRRAMFIAGLLAFTAASLSGGLAHDPALLIASRVVQGAGAAVVAPAALSLITTSFPEGHRRTRALGMYGATASIGFVAGQVLGGILVQFTSWRAVFLVNVPVGLIAAVLAPRLLANSRGPATGHKLDLRGAVLITTSMAAIVFAVSEANVAGWLSPLILGAIVVFAAGIAAFVIAERRHPDPLLPAALIRRPALRAAGSLNLLLGLWNGGEMLVLSLYLQQVLKDSPLATGLLIAPQGVIGFIAGAFGARLAKRIGIRRVLVLTGIVASAGFAVLTQLPATGHYSPVLAAVMLVGFGTAGTAFGTMVIATTGVAGAEQGIVGGVINTSRQIGAALGAALLPAISAAVSHDTLTATARGTRAAMLAAAIAAAVAALIAWRGANAARTRPAELAGVEGAAQPAQAQPLAARSMAAQSVQAQPLTAQALQAQRAHEEPVEDQSPAIRVTAGHDVAVNHAREHRPSALRHRLWDQLATRHGLAASRPVSAGNGHPASGRPPRHDLRRGNLRRLGSS
jgi:EmrB/QacA subfamily drug resistance transporter